MAEDLAGMLADLKEEEALQIVKERLSAGEEPLKILDDARRGMEIVGLITLEVIFQPEMCSINFVANGSTWTRHLMHIERTKLLSTMVRLRSIEKIFGVVIFRSQ